MTRGGAEWCGLALDVATMRMGCMPMMKLSETTWHLVTLTVLVCAISVGLIFVSGIAQRGRTEVAGINVAVTDLTKRIGDADIILIEFGDFQCHFCASQASEAMPRIRRQLIESGKLSYAYVHFPLEGLHPEAFAASEAAECAGEQDTYWDMHERLFEEFGTGSLWISVIRRKCLALMSTHSDVACVQVKRQPASCWIVG